MYLTLLVRVVALAMIFFLADSNSPADLFGLSSCSQVDCSIYNIDGGDDCIPEESCGEELCSEDPDGQGCCELVRGGCYEDNFCDVGESPWECIYEEAH